MYHGDGFFVPGSLDRFSLNTRRNLTYLDDSLIYGGVDPADSDEVFYVLLQSADAVVSLAWESKSACLVSLRLPDVTHCCLLTGSPYLRRRRVSLLLALLWPDGRAA
jgi:hypothetical protein